VRSLNPEDYAKDELVCVRCGGREVWLSERLFRRLVWIGRAYELHLLPLLEEDRSLNAVQAEALGAELAFVGAIFADSALGALLSLLKPVVQAGTQTGAEIRVEWP